MTIGEWPMIDFLVMDLSLAYNAIFGKAAQAQMGIISVVKHQLIKFPSDHGVRTVHGGQPTSRSCYYAHIRNKRLSSTMVASDSDSKKD